MDDHNNLYNEISNFLKNLEDKVEVIINTRKIIKEGNFELEKNQIINKLFEIEDNLRESCRIINKCLIFHKHNHIEIPKKEEKKSKETLSIQLSKKEILPIQTSKKDEKIDKLDKNSEKKEEIILLDEKITLSPIPQLKLQENLEDVPLETPPQRIKPNNNLVKEIPKPKKPEKKIKKEPENIKNNNLITPHKAQNIKNTNRPKLNFVYDNSIHEINTIATGFIPSAKKNETSEKKVNLTYQQPYNTFTEEINMDNEEGLKYENNTNLTLNNLIISNTNENEDLNPIDTASKIKQKATKVSELVVLLNQNEDLFEMLSQLYETNIIDLLLSEDIDDETIDSVYGAVEEIERLKEKDMETE